MFWAHRNLDGTWAPPEQLFTGDGPRLVAGPEDVLHLLWTHGDEIRYANRPASKPWSSAETVIVPRPGYSAGANDMVVDGKGVVHVAVSSWDDIKYVYRDGSNTWSLAELIAATPNGSGNLDLGVDSKGTLYAVWRNGWEPAYNYWRETLFARRDAAGKWSTARKISGASVMAYDSAPLQVVVDGQDRAHVVWNSPNDYVSDVFHILFVGMPAGEAWLRQQLTVPTSAANPGLSFLYQLHQEYPEGENPFSVVIQDGGGATTVFSTPEVTTAWEHRWIDLAPWRGEDVTITFKVQNAADSSPALVDLEEVTVGSAHPDIWVSQSGPSRGSAGAAVRPDHQLRQPGRRCRRRWPRHAAAAARTALHRRGPTALSHDAGPALGRGRPGRTGCAGTHPGDPAGGAVCRCGHDAHGRGRDHQQHAGARAGQ